MKFATLYEKLVKFLRNRDITGVSKKTGTGYPRGPAVFSTEVFHSELNKALQRRDNNRRQRDFKKKKLLERHHYRNFDRRHPEVQKPGRGNPLKRKVWHCNVHGNQTDHTTEWCPVLHPELLEKKTTFIQARSNPLHRIKVEKEPDTEANVTVPKKPDPRDAKFEWGVNFVSINCNLTAADVSSGRRIYDTGA